jgi:dipeptidyl-peptidase-4
MRPWIPVFLLLSLGPVALVKAEQGKKNLTVELVSQEGALVSRGLSGVSWHPDSSRITYLRQKGTGKETVTTLWIYDIKSKTESLLVDSSGEKEKLTLASYQWSPKGDVLLLQGENDLWLIEAKTKEKRRLTKDPEEEDVPTFSPGGNRVAYVKNNNLYSVDLKTGLVEKLTADGEEHVLNGKLDWVYEEELANRRSARGYEWSPDGEKIIYLRLDENRVPEYPITDYLSVHPRLIRQRYPKAGDPNSVPSVHVVTIGNPTTRNLTLPLKPDVEYVAPTFSWTPESKEVCYLTLNRAQNELAAYLWDPLSGKNRQLLVEKDAHWINSLEPPRFLKEGQRFFWLSERDGWLHLYLYDTAGKLLKQVTRGDWLIDGTFELDEKEGWIYFVAAQNDPRERHLYRVRLEGTQFERLSKEPGTHSLKLSPDGHHLVETFSSVGQPPQTLLLRADASFVAALHKPDDRLAEYSLAKTEFLELKTSDGARLYARLVKPADFNLAKKYPVIVYVYGGPHAQVVQNRWGLTTLRDHLLAQEGFLVWSLDNRGSWGRGHVWETTIFKALGRQELADQLEGVSYLKSLPFVDASRLGIWGWSYGGYLTLYGLTHAPDVFKCGLAGAPVTDWKFYDTIYTERYMRTPQENAEGYKDSSPLEAADKLRARLLLIHGTADDNVHLQNTVSFVDALIKARRPYDLQILPGQTHGIREDAPLTYLNERIVEFFRRNL